MLKTQDPSDSGKAPSPEARPPNNPPNPSVPYHAVPDHLSMFTDGMEDVASLPLNDAFGDSQQTMPPLGDPTLGISEEFSWEMIGLGLEEPLPNQDVIDDLYVLL